MTLSIWIRTVALIVGLFSLPTVLAAAPVAPPVELTMDSYTPDWTDHPVTVMVNRYRQENPTVSVRPFSNLKLPGAAGGGESTMLMAFAGGIAPDCLRVWFHQIDPYVQQGFLLDLSEFIGQDTDGDGYISDAEAKWDGWKEIRPAIRRAMTVNGKPYGLPVGDSVYGIIYRRDLVREVTGQDEPPRTWDEFFQVCQKLTRPPVRQADGTLRKGRAGYYANTQAFCWLPWVWSAGGHEIMQGRRSPTDGQMYWFPKEEFAPRSPQGEDLSRIKSEWRLTFASSAGIQATEFYWKLLWQPWVLENGEPRNLTAAEAAQLPEEQVIRGVSRGMFGDQKSTATELFKKGEICFYIGWLPDLNVLVRDFAPGQLGFMPVPSPDGQHGTALMQPYFFCLNGTLARANPAKRQAAWHLLTSVTGDNFRRTAVELARDKDLLRFADPEDLKKFDMEEYLADLPKHWPRQLAEIKERAFTEPCFGYWQAIAVQLIGEQILSRILVDPAFDYRSALQAAEEQGNTKILRGRDESQMRRLRPWAWGGFAVVLALLIWMGRHFWRGMKAAYLKPGSAGFDTRMQEVSWLTRLLPWTFIPAVPTH